MVCQHVEVASTRNLGRSDIIRARDDGPTSSCLGRVPGGTRARARRVRSTGPILAMRVASRARLGGSSGRRPALSRRAFASSPSTVLHYVTMLRGSSLMTTLVLLAACAVLPRAGAHSSRPGSCDARAGHGASDSGDGGYTLTRTSGALDPGARVVVTLSKPVGGSDFKGFVIRASAGTLAPKSTNAAAATSCDSGNAVGHSSSSSKSSAEAYLTLPSAGGAVTVTAHVVVAKMTVHETTLRLEVASPPAPPTPPSPPPAPIALPAPRGCASSSLGYRCVVALAPSVNLHWTPGGVANDDDEGNERTRDGNTRTRNRSSSSASSVPAGRVAFALETTDASARAASVAFQSTASMVPSVAVVGYASDDGAIASVGSYDVRGYSVAGLVGPNASSLPIADASVERTSRGSLIVRFAANVADVGAGRFDGSASGDRHVGWSLASSAGTAYHDIGRGAATIDFANAASVVRAETRAAARRIRTHGALTQAGFVAMLVGSVVAFLGKEDAAESFTRGGDGRTSSSRPDVKKGSNASVVGEIGDDAERAETRSRTRTRTTPSANDTGTTSGKKSLSGSVWIRAHRASQIAGASLAIAGFAVALSREENETRGPFDWGSYSLGGDEETAAAERAAVAHGVVGVVVVAAVAAQFALAAAREPKPNDEGSDGSSVGLGFGGEPRDGRGAENARERSAPRSPPRKIRDAHVLLGWFATVGGLADCVVGAWLSRRRGVDPSEARRFLVVAVVAVAAGGVALVAKVNATVRRRGRA